MENMPCENRVSSDYCHANHHSRSANTSGDQRSGLSASWSQSSCRVPGSPGWDPDPVWLFWLHHTIPLSPFHYLIMLTLSCSLLSTTGTKVTRPEGIICSQGSRLLSGGKGWKGSRRFIYLHGERENMPIPRSKKTYLQCWDSIWRTTN